MRNGQEGQERQERQEGQEGQEGPPPRRRRYGEVSPKLAQDMARAKAEREGRND